MEREVKVRAVLLEKDECIVGYYYKAGDKEYVFKDGSSHEIVIGSARQFCGVINDTEVFVGDVFKDIDGKWKAAQLKMAWGSVKRDEDEV